MIDRKQLIQHLRKVLLGLLVADIILAATLYVMSDSPFGWDSYTLDERFEFTTGQILAILQFVLAAGTVDALIRRACLVHNEVSEGTRIPNLMILIFSVANYIFFGLAGFVLLYNQSLHALIVGSSAIGFSLAYLSKDFIAESIASIQIQMDELFSIGDWIAFGNGDIFCVEQIDRRLVILRNRDGALVKFPSTKFLSGGIKNYSRMPRGSSRRLSFEIDAKHNPDKILAILDVAVRYVLKKNTNNVYYDKYNVRITAIKVGVIVYRIKYFAGPVSITKTDNEMNRAVLKFLALASISLESSINVTQHEEVIDLTRRLLDIRNRSILEVLSFEEIQALGGKIKLCEFRKGETILRHGDSGDSMFFISEGILDIRIPKDGDQTVSVANLWPGDCVGEMSMLTGEARSADVIALSDVVLIQVTKEEMEPILSKNPGLVDRLSRILAERKVLNQKHLSGAEAETETAQETKTIAKRIIGFFALGLRADL